MAESAPETTTARVGMMRSHMACALRATDKLHMHERSSAPDGARIDELRAEVSDELRQVFLLAAMAGLFRPSICGASLAPPPAAPAEPDTVVPFPRRGEPLQPPITDVEGLTPLPLGFDADGRNFRSAT